MMPPFTATADIDAPPAQNQNNRDRDGVADQKISLRMAAKDQFRSWLPGEEAEITITITNEGERNYHGQLELESGGRFILVRQHPPELKIFPQSWSRHQRGAEGEFSGEITLTIRAALGAGADVGTHAVLLRLYYSKSADLDTPEVERTDSEILDNDDTQIADASDWAQWTILPAPQVVVSPVTSASPRGRTHASYHFNVFNPGNVPVQVSLNASEENAERMEAGRRLRFKITRGAKNKRVESRVLLAAERSTRFKLHTSISPLFLRPLGNEVARPFHVQVTQHQGDAAAQAIKIDPVKATFTQVALIPPHILGLLGLVAALIGIGAFLLRPATSVPDQIDISVTPRQPFVGEAFTITLQSIGTTKITSVELKPIEQPVTSSIPLTFTSIETGTWQYPHEGISITQKFLVAVTYDNHVQKSQTVEVNVTHPTPTPTSTLTPTATPTPMPVPTITLFMVSPNPASVGVSVTISYSAINATTCEIDAIGTLDKCDGNVLLFVDGPKTLTFIAANDAGKTARKVELLRLLPTPTPTPIVSLLGGLDLDLQYCGLFGGRAVHNGPNEVATAHTWKCRAGETYYAVDFDRACQMQFGSGAFARSKDPNDPNSWQCFGPKPVATPAPSL